MQESTTSWDIRSLYPMGLLLPLAFLTISLLLFMLPAGKILRRTGHNPLWCVLALFPFLNLVALWFFAFKSWPLDKKPPVQQPPSGP
jgi:hypothetical protein